jgi:hypothetical protein
MSSSVLVENEEARLAKLASARKKVGASGKGGEGEDEAEEDTQFVTLTNILLSSRPFALPALGHRPTRLLHLPLDLAPYPAHPIHHSHSPPHLPSPHPLRTTACRLTPLGRP